MDTLGVQPLPLDLDDSIMTHPSTPPANNSFMDGHEADIESDQGERVDPVVHHDQFDKSLDHSHDLDDPFNSDHLVSEPEDAVFDLYGRPQSSPGTSHHSEDDNVSEMPCESRAGFDSRRQSYAVDTADSEADDVPEGDRSVIYTPQRKQRSPFRNTSSVRALQLSTTPPHLVSASKSQHRYRLSATSRMSTPKSTRSAGNFPRSTGSPSKKVRKEFPLVLLHVTLLPVLCPYSPAVLASVLPPSAIENWQLLREKVSPTVLERGILVPHPREDYDLLEERLLESLELKMPRILKCGHFHLSEEEARDIEDSESEYDSENPDVDICEDCGRRIRDGRFGVGEGERRWEVRVYASNGLMRAGAWGAAWREMERVDVEIGPWIGDKERRELDARQRDEDEMAAAAAAEAMKEHVSDRGMDEERKREVYGVQSTERADTRPPHSHAIRHEELPISKLLANYVHILLQDKRNLVIAGLSILVVLLAMIPKQTTMAPLPTVREVLATDMTTSLPPPVAESVVPESIIDEILVQRVVAEEIVAQDIAIEKPLAEAPVVQKLETDAPDPKEVNEEYVEADINENSEPELVVEDSQPAEGLEKETIADE